MKLSCLQDNLNRGLGIVSRAVASRTTLPITNNVLLQTDQNRLKLVATNLEMAITCWIVGKVEREGEITVPAKLLDEFVGSLPSEQVDIELPAGGGTLELKCARFAAKISGAAAADFPRRRRLPADTYRGRRRHRQRGGGGLEAGDRPGGICRRYRRIAPGAHRRLC